VKISELSSRSGVPQPTIKYYIREGLLAPGAKTARNQAQYAEEHLTRLRLIVALRESGGLSLESIKTLFAALKESPSPQVAAMAHAGLSPAAAAGPRDETWAATSAQLAEYLRGLGWQVYPESPEFQHLVDAYVALRAAWPAELAGAALALDALRPYAEAAHHVAGAEVAREEDVERLTPEAMLHWVVLGTVLMEPVLLALRRVAHQDLGSRRWAQWFKPAAPP
jgi:DNA-binding transcriptional MerR regulator